MNDHQNFAVRRPLATRWRVAAATLAVGVTTAVASTMVFAQTPPDGVPPPPHGRMHGGPMHGPGMMGPGFDGHLLDRVGATADQKDKIHTIFKAAFTDMKSSHDQERAGRDQMMALLTAPTIDRNAIESLRIQQHQLEDTTSRRMTQALADAASVLTPEQRAKIAVDIQDRKASMQQHMEQRQQRQQAAPKG
jgi:Spy/CpxP family protein refolding chaperone